MTIDTVTRAFRFALSVVVAAGGVGPSAALAVDRADLFEAWRVKDRAVRDYGRALREKGNPSVEDRGRLRREIIAPAEQGFSRARQDYHREQLDRLREKAAKAERTTDERVSREMGKRTKAPAGKKQAKVEKTKAGKGKAESKAAPKVPVDRPGVPNPWERAPRREVVVDPEGIPEEIIFEKNRKKGSGNE